MSYRFFRLVLPILLCSFPGFSQRGVGVAPKPQEVDTAKVNLLIEETYALRETDPPKALTLGLEAIVIARQLGYRKGLARAAGSLGWIYYRKGDFVKGLENSIEALKISEQIGDQVEVARCLNNVAAIYYEEKQYDKSLDNFKKALKVSRQIGDTKTFTRSLNNIAHLYIEAWNNLDSAQAYATRALVLSEKTGDHYNGAFSNRTLGDLYSARKEFSKTLKHYFRSLELSEAVSNSLKVATWRRIAKVYIDQQRILDAAVILEKNIAVARKYGYREELARCYQLLAECYEKQGAFSRAFDFLQRYTTLHDSIYNQQNSRRLAVIQGQFDLDLKQAQIELLIKDTQLNKKEISRQRIELYATIGGFLAILLIASLLFYGNRRVNRTNILLERQKDELAGKNREVELKSKELEYQADQLANINATKDKLFSIIGHDFLSPLNSLKGMLTLAENKGLSQQEFASLAGSLKINLDSVSATLENLLHWSLAQLHGIQTNPVRINIQSVVGEHITLFQELARAKNIRLENGISEILFAYADENHTRLVLRNLINNAIKFTHQGGIIRISNQRENPFVKIMVSDTGIGMEPTRVRSLFQRIKHSSIEGTNKEKGTGIGLILCQEFVENNGGRMSVASELGKGSVFSFTLKAA